LSIVGTQLRSIHKAKGDTFKAADLCQIILLFFGILVGSFYDGVAKKQI